MTSGGMRARALVGMRDVSGRSSSRFTSIATVQRETSAMRVSSSGPTPTLAERMPGTRSGTTRTGAKANTRTEPVMSEPPPEGRFHVLARPGPLDRDLQPVPRSRLLQAGAEVVRARERGAIDRQDEVSRLDPRPLGGASPVDLRHHR